MKITILSHYLPVFAAADAAKSVGDQVREKQAEATGDTSTAVAVTGPTMADNSVVLNGVAFKAKQVTRSVIPQRDGQTLFVSIDGLPYEGKPLANGKKDMAPATLVNVTDLSTGELGLLIVNKVLAGQLEELYPKGGFVGKSFAITMKPAADGKRYKTFVLYELEAA